jgi:hypothetical protein
VDILKAGRIDMVKRQGVVQVGLTHVEMRRQRREFHVGNDATILRAVAVGAIELLGGDFDRPQVVAPAAKPAPGNVQSTGFAPFLAGWRCLQRSSPAVILIVREYPAKATQR